MQEPYLFNCYLKDLSTKFKICIFNVKMNIMQSIIASCENFVIETLNTSLDANHVYHNLAHTQRVVKAVEELSALEMLNEIQKELLTIAAWLHDIGYTVSNDNHEEIGAQIADKFLTSQSYESDKIAEVKRLILATKMDHIASDLLEGIIRDADSAHLGSKSFFEISELLKKELELYKESKISDMEWLETNIHFMTSHKFNSKSAIDNWNKRKDKNLGKLLHNASKLSRDNKKIELKKENLEIKKDKKELPERGIETMFRVALRNHITLSDIADTKANILLSVNAIIISVALSNLLPKLDNPSNAYLIYPTLIFLGFTVASIVLSVMATRPNVTKGKFSKEDVANKKVNLLFFGNFHQMNISDFEWAMNEMMQDRDYLYGSLTKDLYFLGLVLNRKYSLLRITYTVFMIGIVISVLAFAIAFYTSGQA